MRRIALSVCLCLGPVLVGPMQPQAADARPCMRVADPEFPVTPAGRCARAFMSALANPTPEAVRSFETAWASKVRLGRTAIEQRIVDLPKVREDLGGVAITRVDGTKEPLTVFARSARGEELAFEFDMSAAEPGKLDAVRISPASEATSTPLTPELIKNTVEGVAEALRTGYVFPEVGAKMADTILAKHKAGGYDTLTGDRALAMQLTDDCRDISRDKHLGIRPVAGTAPATVSPGGENPRRENFGFKRVELFPGNIGYVRFDVFFNSKEAFGVASSAMNFLAGADAIIFDLRHNGGGSPEMIRYITSYLFETPTHLNDMVNREGKVVEEFWTFDEVPGRRPGPKVPVFVLTSNKTFSGAEEFAYNLQNMERATIIGETTGGGAHPVRGSRVNDRFMVRVPHMRAQNPITHTNWEGRGVEPDVAVAAEAALDKALELAREAAGKVPAER